MCWGFKLIRAQHRACPCSFSSADVAMALWPWPPPGRNSDAEAHFKSPSAPCSFFYWNNFKVSACALIHRLHFAFKMTWRQLCRHFHDPCPLSLVLFVGQQILWVSNLLFLLYKLSLFGKLFKTNGPWMIREALFSSEELDNKPSTLNIRASLVQL